MKNTILSGKGWRILLSDLELERSFLPFRGHGQPSGSTQGQAYGHDIPRTPPASLWCRSWSFASPRCLFIRYAV